MFYAAPECKNEARYTEKADVWAFGLSACEIVVPNVELNTFKSAENLWKNVDKL